MIFEQSVKFIRESHRLFILASCLVSVIILSVSATSNNVNRELYVLDKVYQEHGKELLQVLSEHVSVVIKNDAEEATKRLNERIQAVSKSWVGSSEIEFPIVVVRPNFYHSKVSAVADYSNYFYLDVYVNSIRHELAGLYGTLSDSGLNAAFEDLGDNESFILTGEMTRQSYDVEVSECKAEGRFKVNDGFYLSMCLVSVMGPEQSFPVSETFPLYNTTYRYHIGGGDKSEFELVERRYDYDSIESKFNSHLSLLEKVVKETGIISESQMYLTRLYAINALLEDKANADLTMNEFIQNQNGLKPSSLDQAALPFGIKLSIANLFIYFPAIFIALVYYAYVHLDNFRKVVPMAKEVEDLYYPAAILNDNHISFKVTAAITVVASILPLIALAISDTLGFELIGGFGWILFFAGFLLALFYCKALDETRDLMFDKRAEIKKKKEPQARD
ncbi:hypothetical protein [Photobacterium kasasachensis]|uniref:hypothetical protein n=1 Tax=Photobacterium kasasachensis TaxID=2910240 RepID=UPI003D095B86